MNEDDVRLILRSELREHQAGTIELLQEILHTLKQIQRGSSITIQRFPWGT